MLRYILRRLAIAVPILIAISFLIFSLLQFTPGDPVDAYLPPDQPISPEMRETMIKQLGLDRPFLVRYGYWLKEAVQGNLGYRLVAKEPVVDAISTRVGATLLLMGTAMGIGILVGVGFGVVAAVKQYSLVDSLLTVFAFLGLSLPVYLTGLIGLYLFSLRFDWFPSGGYSTPGQPFSWTDRLHHLVLPATIIAVNYIASTMRYTRSAMLDVLGQDYVRTARAKGLGEQIVIGRHAFRNALLPVVTIIGANLAYLLGGAVFIESIFGWPGLGRLFLEGVGQRDYPLIMGMTLFLAIMILLANLITDVVYALVDPRIRYD
ncbi:MAG: ABC transporter permease [Thermomicrobiales bacterium]|nr:ABC transporter permease [Thermomicrobiales bacterium]